MTDPIPRADEPLNRADEMDELHMRASQGLVRARLAYIENEYDDVSPLFACLRLALDAMLALDPTPHTLAILGMQEHLGIVYKDGR